MDDKARFDQLEEIIVELLRKQDRTMEALAFLREAVEELGAALARMHADLVRINSETAATRRLANETGRLLCKTEQELIKTVQRCDRMFAKTASVLAGLNDKPKGPHQKLAAFWVETPTNSVGMREMVQKIIEFKIKNRTGSTFVKNPEY